MAVIRLGSGGLFLWSPVALSDALKAEISALGPVAHLVAPNALHHMALADWAAAFPSARIHAAPGLRQKRPDIAFSTDLGPAAPPDWAGEIEQTLMPNRIAPEIVFFHRASGTVLFTDLLQQMPRGWYRGWRALVARLDLMCESQPTVPRKFRLATDKRPARAALETILHWPAQNIVMAHGTPVAMDALAFLLSAFRWLR